MKNIVKKILDFNVLKSSKKIVIIMSDDWGSVRMQSGEAKSNLINNGYVINNRFDQFDCLESNDDIELLFDVLTKYKDYKGNHPVITAVTNVGNPDFQKIKKNSFKTYFHETIDKTYNRYPNSDRVLSLTQEGIKNNIFVPQSHGREHVQFNWWMQELQNEESFARKFFEDEFFFLGAQFLTHPKRNRGIGASFDVWNADDIKNSKLVAESSLQIFKDLYGYSSNVFTPPAMFYNPSIEPILKNEGIEWIDVGRYFKVPMDNGKDKFQLNYLGKTNKSGLKVLVRNCVYESNMTETDNGVNRCLFDIEQAFKAKQPAIISNHRASFAGGISVLNRDNGLQSFDLLLQSILKKWADVEFVSASDLKKQLC